MVISAEYWSKFQAFGDVSIWVKDSHLLPQEITFFSVSYEGRSHIVASYDKQGGTEVPV